MRIKIDEIAYEFGSEKEDLSVLKQDNPEWDIDKSLIQSINNRHCSSDDETALDLAISAAKKLTNNLNDVDLLLFVAQSPDFIFDYNAVHKKDCHLVKTLQLLTLILVAQDMFMR